LGTVKLYNNKVRGAKFVSELSKFIFVDVAQSDKYKQAQTERTIVKPSKKVRLSVYFSDLKRKPENSIQLQYL